MKTKAKTLRYVCDMDWRKQTKNGYPDIPQGETVDIIEEGIDNMYGYGLVKVRWNGTSYLVKPEDFER